MLLAYLDEIGEPGAFVARDHPRFRTSPAFGYAGFVVPDDGARRVGDELTASKRRMFGSELSLDVVLHRWERKGASIFRPATDRSYRHQLHVFDRLSSTIVGLGGRLFFCAVQKPVGTPRQTSLDVESRETHALRLALDRVARLAQARDQNVLVMLDQVNEKTRKARLPVMDDHIIARAVSHPEMLRIVEPPMHIDSSLSATIQLADWVAACVTRAIDHHLLPDSPYAWLSRTPALRSTRTAFAAESALVLDASPAAALTASEVFAPNPRR